MPLLILATMLTVAFGLLAWLGLGAYLAWLPVEMGRELSLPWRMALGLALPFPWHALPWQVIGLLSLIWTVLGARSPAPSSSWPLAQRLLVHLAVIILMLLSVGVAMLAPLINIASVLG